MITVAQVLESNSRIPNPELIAQLANELVEAKIPVKASDPFECWESHPVLPKYFNLKDRQICIAIDLASKSWS
jgi:hypothetical protein